MTNIGSKSQAELVSALRGGDKAAFRQLYFHYYEQLYRFAFFRTGSEEVSKDLLQDLFYRIWESRQRLNPEKSFKAYLYKSLGNMIIDNSRRKSAQNLSLERVPEAKSSDYDVSGIDVKNAIEKLPVKLQEVLSMSRYEGFKYSEIAEILGISLKAVEKRMTKAFKLLKSILSE